MTKWDEAKWEMNRVFAARRGGSQEDIFNAVCAAFEKSGQRLTEQWKQDLNGLARTASHGGHVNIN